MKHCRVNNNDNNDAPKPELQIECWFEILIHGQSRYMNCKLWLHYAIPHFGSSSYALFISVIAPVVLNKMLSLDPPNNVHIPYALLHFSHLPLKSLKAIYFAGDGKPIKLWKFLILHFLPSSPTISYSLSMLNSRQEIGDDISLKRLGEAKLMVIGLFNHFVGG